MDWVNLGAIFGGVGGVFAGAVGLMHFMRDRSEKMPQCVAKVSKSGVDLTFLNPSKRLVFVHTIKLKNAMTGSQTQNIYGEVESTAAETDEVVVGLVMKPGEPLRYFQYCVGHDRYSAVDVWFKRVCWFNLSRGYVAVVKFRA